MNKRNDLQWIRALAIFAVVAFHLEPKIIPYGYLGVDIFFVLSGYLMTLILSKNRSLITFYGNRIKRIFPTCLLIISVLCIIGYFLLLPMDFDFFKSEVLWSIFFINNMYPIFHQKQYFEMVSEFKFLLHTWSLGVEIQFYLIAPFLLIFLLSRKQPLLWISFFGFCSFLFQLFVPNENVAFGLVFCRIWQFLVGSFAYCYSNNQEIKYQLLLPTADGADTTKNDAISDYKNNNYNFTIFTFLGLISICFYPLSLDHIYIFPIILRSLGTLLTGLFIALNSIQPINLNEKLDSFLVYIGDASYVIYLVHWPTIIYFKYFSINYGELAVMSRGWDSYKRRRNIFTLFIIVSIALIIFNFFEIPMRKVSIQYNIYFIVFCYAIILLLHNVNNEKSITNSIEKNSSNLTRLNAAFLNPIHQNEIEAKSCLKLYYNNCVKSPILDKYLTVRPNSEQPESYCSYKLNSNATKTIMITGNSFVHYQIRGVLDAIKESKTQFKEAYFIEHPACSIIAGKLNHMKGLTCEKYDGSFDILLNATKPDIIIHSSRLDHFITEKKLESKNISESDYYYKEFKRSILNIAQYSPRLIIIEPNPIMWGKKYKNPLTIAHTLQSNGSISAFNISIEKFHEMQNPTWNRVKKAVENCSNCVIVPTQNLYCKETYCPAADSLTQLGMYCDDSHLTPRFSLCLKPSVIEAIDFEKPNLNNLKCDLAMYKNVNEI